MALNRAVPWDAQYIRSLVEKESPIRGKQLYLHAPRVVILLALDTFGDRVLVTKLAKLMEESAEYIGGLADFLQEEFTEWQETTQTLLERAFLEAYVESEHGELIRVQLGCKLITMSLEHFGDETTVPGTLSMLKRADGILRGEASHLRDGFGEWLRDKLGAPGIQQDVGPPDCPEALAPA